jgi:hypothetical protein
MVDLLLASTRCLTTDRSAQIIFTFWQQRKLTDVHADRHKYPRRLILYHSSLTALIYSNNSLAFPEHKVITALNSLATTLPATPHFPPANPNHLLTPHTTSRKHK